MVYFFNPYISYKTLITYEHFSIYTAMYTAMREGLDNVSKAFRGRLTVAPINPNIENTYVPSNFSQRMVHVIVGFALCVPGVGNVTLFALKKFCTIKVPQMTLGKANLVISTCIKTLNAAENKDLVGVFRVPGFETRLQSWINTIKTKQDLNESDIVNLFTKEGVPCHDIAKLMTRVLNSLPSPFLTEAEYTKFIATIQEDKDLLRVVVDLLPPQKKAIFIQVFSYLNELIKQSEITKMTKGNLATNWGPTIFSAPNFKAEDLQITYFLCGALIDLAPQLSVDSSPLSDRSKLTKDMPTLIASTEELGELTGKTSLRKRSQSLDKLDQREKGSRKNSF